jgi:hypothetical protein
MELMKLILNFKLIFKANPFQSVHPWIASSHVFTWRILLLWPTLVMTQKGTHSYTISTIVPNWDWTAFKKRRNGNGLAKMAL